MAVALPLQSPPDVGPSYCERREVIADAVQNVIDSWADELHEELTDAEMSGDFTRLASWLRSRTDEYVQRLQMREAA